MVGIITSLLSRPSHGTENGMKVVKTLLSCPISGSQKGLIQQLSRAVSIYSCMEKPNTSSFLLTSLCWSHVMCQGVQQSYPIQQRAAQTCTEQLAAITWHSLQLLLPNNNLCASLALCRRSFTAACTHCPPWLAQKRLPGCQGKLLRCGTGSEPGGNLSKMPAELICLFLCTLSAPSLSGKWLKDLHWPRQETQRQWVSKKVFCPFVQDASAALKSNEYKVRRSWILILFLKWISE